MIRTFVILSTCLLAVGCKARSSTSDSDIASAASNFPTVKANFEKASHFKLGSSVIRSMEVWHCTTYLASPTSTLDFNVRFEVSNDIYSYFVFDKITGQWGDEPFGKAHLVTTNYSTNTTDLAFLFGSNNTSIVQGTGNDSSVKNMQILRYLGGLGPVKLYWERSKKKDTNPQWNTDCGANIKPSETAGSLGMQCVTQFVECSKA